MSPLGTLLGALLGLAACYLLLGGVAVLVRRHDAREQAKAATNPAVTASRGAARTFAENRTLSAYVGDGLREWEIYLTQHARRSNTANRPAGEQ